MLDLGWPSLLILALTALTIILTVWIGIRGLHTNLVRSGQLTRKGRYLALAMCGLGALTFALGLGDRVIAYQKEQQDARQRQRQFREQMGKLEQATHSLEQLQNGMRNSLRRQEQLYGIANQNLRMNSALQQQNQADTLAVLQRVFQESNRVSVERIAVAVTYLCPRYERFHDSPEIKQANLVIQHRTGREIKLMTRQLTEVSGGIIFHGFLGDLGPLEAFPEWRDAHIHIRLTGGVTPEFTSLDEFVRMTDEERQRSANPKPVSCHTTLRLLLNGRQVLSSEAQFVKRGDRFDGYAANLVNLRVEAKRLPQFAP